MRVPILEKESLTIDFAKEFEKLALFVAQAWLDEHPNANLHSQTDFQDCVQYVTAELAKAGSAVGGPAGLELLTGGGSEAACKVCKSVLVDRNVEA